MDFAKKLHQTLSDQLHEAMAQRLAEKARELGLNSTDSIRFEIASEDEASDFQIDADRVCSRADAILAEG